VSWIQPILFEGTSVPLPVRERGCGVVHNNRRRRKNSLCVDKRAFRGELQ